MSRYYLCFCFFSFVIKFSPAEFFFNMVSINEISFRAIIVLKETFMSLFPLLLILSTIYFSGRKTCASQPCFPGVMCKDLNSPYQSFVCGACPKYYYGNGEKCYRNGRFQNFFPCFLLTYTIVTILKSVIGMVGFRVVPLLYYRNVQFESCTPCTSQTWQVLELMCMYVSGSITCLFSF